MYTLSLILELRLPTLPSYSDAPTEGIRRLLEWFLGEKLPRNELIDTSRIAWVRMGTTVCTNALLERKGERHAMLIVSLGGRSRIEQH